MSRQIEFNAPDGAVRARQRDVQFARGRRQRPALHQERDENDDEGDVEIDVRAGNADQQRDRCEEDADRTAQADPGDEQLFAPGKRNGARQMKVASGRATNISASAITMAGSRLPTRRSGDTNRPSSTNITICASQVMASRNTTTVLWARIGRLPTIESCEIDGEKSRPVQRLRQPEDRQHAGDDERRMQALRQRDAIERQHDEAAAAEADDRAERGFARQLDQNADRAAAAAHQISTSRMVRKIASGSLVADSTSSVAPTRGRKRNPRE